MKNQERFNATIERVQNGILPAHPKAVSTAKRDTAPYPRHSFRNEDDEQFRRFVSSNLPKYKASPSLIERIKDNIQHTKYEASSSRIEHSEGEMNHD